MKRVFLVFLTVLSSSFPRNVLMCIFTGNGCDLANTPAVSYSFNYHQFCKQKTYGIIFTVLGWSQWTRAPRRIPLPASLLGCPPSRPPLPRDLSPQLCLPASRFLVMLLTTETLSWDMQAERSWLGSTGGPGRCKHRFSWKEIHAQASQIPVNQPQRWAQA